MLLPWAQKRLEIAVHEGSHAPRERFRPGPGESTLKAELGRPDKLGAPELLEWVQGPSRLNAKGWGEQRQARQQMPPH